LPDDWISRCIASSGPFVHEVVPFCCSVHIPIGLRGDRLVKAGVFTVASVISYLFPDLFVDLVMYAFALRIHYHGDYLH
jgi:hypothetical protein